MLCLLSKRSYSEICLHFYLVVRYTTRFYIIIIAFQYQFVTWSIIFHIILSIVLNLIMFQSVILAGVLCIFKVNCCRLKIKLMLFGTMFEDKI